MSLLSIVQNVCDEVGISRPSVVVGSTNQQIRQLLALSRRGGKLLAGLGHWTVLTKEHTFATVNGTDAYALPDDFDYIVNQTAWDRANYRRMREAISPPLWQAIKSGLVQTNARWKGFRIKGSSATRFYIDPTPTSADTLVFEYQSLNWCRNAAGDTDRAAWAADDDTGILPEALLELDLIWRWRHAKGLDYAEDFRTFQMEADKALARDGGRPVLDLGDRPSRFFDPNIQDADFPS